MKIEVYFLRHKDCKSGFWSFDKQDWVDIDVATRYHNKRIGTNYVLTEDAYKEIIKQLRANVFDLESRLAYKRKMSPDLH